MMCPTLSNISKETSTLGVSKTPSLLFLRKKCLLFLEKATLLLSVPDGALRNARQPWTALKSTF